MKKLFTFITLAFAGAISAFSQPAEGYYRVKNAQTNRYVSIVNDKIDNANRASLERGGSGNVFALRMKDQAEVISDPGSIIYLSPASEKEYILEGQGMNTYQLSKLYLTIFTGTEYRADGVAVGSTLSGAYWMHGTASGVRRYMFDTVTKVDIDYNWDTNKVKGYACMEAAGVSKGVDAKANWYFNPIDNVNEYLGLTPEVEADGKYYTTIYCSFPIKVGEGMKVWTIKEYTKNNNLAEAAQIVEVEDGIVPANTAVIIECKSKDPADNKVTLLTAAEVSGKKLTTVLEGRYFSYIPRASDGLGENTNMAELKDALPYTPAQMRVLGSVDGKLSLVKPSENGKDKQLVVTNSNKYMLPNKAFLWFANLPEVITLTTEALSIRTFGQEKAQDTDIYNLQGQKVADKGTSVDELPRGLYIINGKKVIKY